MHKLRNGAYVGHEAWGILQLSWKLRVPSTGILASRCLQRHWPGRGAIILKVFASITEAELSEK